MLAHTPKKACLPHSQFGLSLIELMIALAIGLFLLIGITSLIVQQSGSRDELEKSSRQIENGRYAMEILAEDIEHAGYYGTYYTTPTAPGSLPDPCLVDLASLTAQLPMFIQGYNAGTPAVSPLGCISSANLAPGTSILVIRRADTPDPPLTPIAAAAALPPRQVYLQSNASNFVLNTGSAGAGAFALTDNLPTAPLSGVRKYFVHIYFISPCSVMANGSTCQSSDDKGSPIPTLKRMELGVDSSGNSAMVLTPLVEGIQAMQLDFGLDTTPTGGDGYPDVYCTDPNTASTCSSTTYVPGPAPVNWLNVMAIRVNLLARANDRTTGYSDTKQYQLSGIAGAPALGPFGDSYKRHVFTQLVRLVNPSSRRALQ